MRNERRILTNTVILLGSEVIGQLANLVLIVTLARHYGAATLGEYSLSMAVGAVAALGVTLGLDGLMVRELSQHPERARTMLGTLLPAQALIVPVAWLGAIAVSYGLIRDTSAIPMIVCVTGYQMLSTVATLFIWPIQAGERMLEVAVVETTHRLVALLLGGVAVLAGMSASVFALAFPISAIVFIILASRQFSRNGAPLYRWAPAAVRDLYRQGLPFFSTSALGELYSRSATLLLGIMVGRQAVGLYTAADRLMVPLLLAPAVFNAAVYPVLSRLARESVQAAREMSARCIRLLLLGTIPLSLLAALLAPVAIALLFGDRYVGAADALRWLVWSLPLRGTQKLLGSQLAALGQQGRVASARAIGVLQFFLLAPLLIHFFGYVGVAMALPLCDATQVLLYLRALRSIDAAPALRQAVLAPLGAASLTIPVYLLLQSSPLWVLLAAIAPVLMLGLYLSGSIKAHDIRYLKGLLRREPAVPGA